MSSTVAEVQTLKQLGQFTALHINDIGLIFRPVKSILFQSFMPQAEAVAVPIQDLYNIPLPVAETKQVLRQGVEPQLLGNTLNISEISRKIA